MQFLLLTLPDKGPFLIRVDQVLQVRPREVGSELWFPSGTVVVLDSVDEILEKLNRLGTEE